jgi:hypothetical protein
VLANDPEDIISCAKEESKSLQAGRRLPRACMFCKGIVGELQNETAQQNTPGGRRKRRAVHAHACEYRRARPFVNLRLGAG